MSLRTSAMSASRAALATLAAAVCHAAVASYAATDDAKAVWNTGRRRPRTVLARITFSPRQTQCRSAPWALPFRATEAARNPHESRKLIREKDNATRPNLPAGLRHNFSRGVMVLQLLPGYYLATTRLRPGSPFRLHFSVRVSLTEISAHF